MRPSATRGPTDSRPRTGDRTWRAPMSTTEATANAGIQPEVAGPPSAGHTTATVTIATSAAPATTPAITDDTRTHHRGAACTATASKAPRRISGSRAGVA